MSKVDGKTWFKKILFWSCEKKLATGEVIWDSFSHVKNFISHLNKQCVAWHNNQRTSNFEIYLGRIVIYKKITSWFVQNKLPIFF
jgi:hypothetical protein